MRKGFTLVEIFVVIVLLPFVAIILDLLFANIVTNIPKASRIVHEHTTVISLLGQIQADVDKATALPDSAGEYEAGEDVLLIKLADSTVGYELKEGKVVRRRLDAAGQDGESTIWTVPNSDIRWSMLKAEGTAYAVEVRTHIRHKLRRRIQEKMANSHLYFLRSL
jgi:hypothetical protein